MEGKKDSLQTAKAKILEQKKKAINEANKKLRELEKKEAEKRLKPYIDLLKKYQKNISDNDLKTMTTYLNRFAPKK